MLVEVHVVHCRAGTTASWDDWRERLKEKNLSFTARVFVDAQVGFFVQFYVSSPSARREGSGRCGGGRIWYFNACANTCIHG